MISKTMQTILHALSYGNIEVEASRRLADIKKLDAMRIFLKKLDTKVYNGTYEVPVRLYFPNEESMSGDVSEKGKYPVLLLLFTFIIIAANFSVCFSESNTTFLLLNSSIISESIPSMENSLNTMYINSIT